MNDQARDKVAHPFIKFDTAGNTTLFVTRTEGGQGGCKAELTADQIACLKDGMRCLRAEQAGYIAADCHAVSMAGGEFCLNAALAFMAVNNWLKKNPVASLCIGNVLLEGSSCGAAPLWASRVKFAKKLCSLKQTKAGPLVAIPGISHLLIQTRQFPERNTALDQGRELFTNLALDQEAAAGIIWWKETESGLEILPLVMVPGAGTLNFEAGCGSGSLALAAFKGDGKYQIRQPSGEFITIQIQKEIVSIRAFVRLLAEGKFWCQA